MDGNAVAVATERRGFIPLNASREQTWKLHLERVARGEDYAAEQRRPVVFVGEGAGCAGDQTDGLGLDHSTLERIFERS